MTASTVATSSPLSTTSVAVAVSIFPVTSEGLRTVNAIDFLLKCPIWYIDFNNKNARTTHQHCQTGQTGEVTQIAIVLSLRIVDAFPVHLISLVGF